MNVGKHPQKEADLPAWWNAGFILWLSIALQTLSSVTPQNICLPSTEPLSLQNVRQGLSHGRCSVKKVDWPNE